MNFDQAFHTLLGHEGGFTDDPRDPGGGTGNYVVLNDAKYNYFTGRKVQ